MHFRDIEDSHHLFLHCSFARGLWIKLFNVKGETWIGHVKIKIFFQLIIIILKLRDLKILYNFCILAIPWLIWIQRNKQFFNDHFLGLDIVWEKLKFLANSCIKANMLFKDFALNDFCWSEWLTLLLLVVNAVEIPYP